MFIADTSFFCKYTDVLDKIIERKEKIIISSLTIDELSKIKNKKNLDISYNAEKALINIEKNIQYKKYLKIDNELKNKNNNDSYIDKLIIKYKNKNCQLLSCDLANIIKAKTYEIETINPESIFPSNIYTGTTKYQINSESIDKLYIEKKINCNIDLIQNTYVVLENFEENKSALCRYKNNLLYLLEANTAFGIKPKNKEQKFCLDAIFAKDIDVVTIEGTSGSGKTLISLASALEEVLEKENYSKILIIRPMVAIQQNIGFLPGDKNEKLDSWYSAIWDQIPILFDTKNKNVNFIEELKNNPKIELEAVTFLRGRSLNKYFIIIDEAQNIPPSSIKTILTRVGAETKVVLTGDSSQIDLYNYTQETNGLTILINKFKGLDNYAHIRLAKAQRSKVCEQAVELL
jgi:PhoH-like ATPase